MTHCQTNFVFLYTTNGFFISCCYTYFLDSRVRRFLWRSSMVIDLTIINRETANSVMSVYKRQIKYMAVYKRQIKNHHVHLIYYHSSRRREFLPNIPIYCCKDRHRAGEAERRGEANVNCYHFLRSRVYSLYTLFFFIRT